MKKFAKKAIICMSIIMMLSGCANSSKGRHISGITSSELLSMEYNEVYDIDDSFMNSSRGKSKIKRTDAGWIIRTSHAFTIKNIMFIANSDIE